MYHDNLDDMFQAIEWLCRDMPASAGDIAVAKTDFKSAFKTLGVCKSQEWMQYLVLQNPDDHSLIAVKANTQTFGSIGAGAAWWRVAQALKAILRKKFRLPAFIYVDDVFVLVPQSLAREALQLVKFVLKDMLGWDLDDEKSMAGQDLVVLGARFIFKERGIQVSIPEFKRLAWLEEL